MNIRWVTIATDESLGVIKFLVDKSDLAYRSLHQAGWTVSLVEVLAIDVADKPGGLHAVADCLAKNKINVENSSGFVSHNRAVLLIEVADITAARASLAKQHLRLLSEEEILKL